MSEGKIIRGGMLECVICFEPFQHESVDNGSHVPHILPKCGHTLCYSCLASMSGPSHCPTCRAEFDIQSNTLKANYPKNFQLLEHITLINEREKGKAVVQQPPKCEGGLDCGAVDVYCPECVSSFCNTCFSVVHKIGKLKLHKAAKWNSQMAVAAALPPSRMCPYHPDFPLNIVCQERTCPRKDSVMCLMCEKFGPEHKGHASDLLTAVASNVRGQLYELVGAVTNEVDVTVAALVRAKRVIESIEPSGNNCSNAVAGTKQVAIDTLNAGRELLYQAVDNCINALVEEVVANAKVRTDSLAAQTGDLRQFVSTAYQWIEENHNRLRSADDFALMKSFAESKELIMAAAAVPRFLQPVYDASFEVTLMSDIATVNTIGRVAPPVKVAQREVKGVAAGMSKMKNIKFMEGSTTSGILGEDLLESMDRMFDTPVTLTLLQTCAGETVTQRKSSAAVFTDLLRRHHGKNIMVLVSSDQGHVFGACIHDYRSTHLTWTRGSDKNFLFALGNLTGKPIKLLPNPARTNGIFLGPLGPNDGIYLGDRSGDFGINNSRCYNQQPTVFTVFAPGFDNTIPLTDGMTCGTPGDIYISFQIWWRYSSLIILCEG